MKKIFLSIMAIGMIATSANAQMRFGAEAGLNMSNTTVSESGLTLTPSVAYGGRVGVVMDYAFSDNLSLQPGIFYSMMGYKLSMAMGGITETNTVSLNYIHIPINVVYRMDAGPGKFFIGAGPYLGYGISGTSKTSVTGGGVGIDTSYSSTVKFGSDSTSQKALDFGIGVNVGYELPMRLFFRAGYDYGLANLSNASGVTSHNTCIHISVGYFFGKKD